MYWIYEQFEATADRSPRRAALKTDTQQMTYRDLAHIVGQRARVLADQSLCDEAIGIIATPTVDTIAWILAILRSGCAYVPIHHGSGPERIQQIADHTGMRAIVEDSGDLKQITPAQSDAQPLPPDVAYIIFTSGTTGLPKGVPITHANYRALHEAAGSLFEFTEDDSWLLYHSLAFDFSVWELFEPLLRGAALAIPTAANRLDGARLADFMHRHDVTILNQVPSGFRMNRRAIATSRAAHQLRYMIFGGERLERDDWKPWTDQFGFDSPSLVNMYGITETTVHATHHLITKTDLDSTSTQLGHPLPGFTAQVRDASGGQSETGELYLAGPQVTSHYLGAPAISAKRFSYDERTGKRFFATRDKLSSTAAGQLTFIDRLDRQLKIRGFRIEPREIELALEAIAGVERAVVTAVDRGRGAELGAVCVGDGSLLSPRHLRRELRLDHYKVPTLIRTCERIPLNTNGKPDLKALKSMLGGQ